MSRRGFTPAGLVRAAVVALLVVAAVALLFTVVFPWVDRTFVNDPVLQPSQRLG
ncbi:MAG TPA: hypothetical protein VG452_13025 [Egibacteraceae bacterium]|nr:hypothetical protein [Actinomycetota bacterium]HWB73131.1 hypothetical protein [Egibacteraceae bacterium]